MCEISFEIKKTDKYQMIIMAGELNISNKDKFYQTVKDEIDFAKLLILDLKELSYLDSSGIGILLEMAKATLNNNHQLIAINLSDRVNNIFKLVGLTKFIKILDSTTTRKIILGQ